MKTKHYIINSDCRNLEFIKNEYIDLIITSPPYWNIKDYGDKNQIGFNNTYEEYIENLNIVWKECYRVLKTDRRMCINIGDQYTRTTEYGRHKVISIKTDIVKYCESIGFDYMGAIIWQKVSTMNTTGGAVIMGSYPYPYNGIIKLDYEYILIFKKIGKNKEKTDKEIKEKSKLTKEEWNKYFTGHWNFPGVRQKEHIAMFPLELPYRLIKMFSFVGDIILDPFAGSGTTSLAAIKLDRNSIGVEINKKYFKAINDKLKDEKEFELKFLKRNMI